MEIMKNLKGDAKTINTLRAAWNYNLPFYLAEQFPVFYGVEPDLAIQKLQEGKPFSRARAR